MCTGIAGKKNTNFVETVFAGQRDSETNSHLPSNNKFRSGDNLVKVSRVCDSMCNISAPIFMSGPHVKEFSTWKLHTETPEQFKPRLSAAPELMKIIARDNSI
jgi:hypothetical protein